MKIFGLIFWFCILCMVYVYAGYPLILAALAGLRWRVEKFESLTRQLKSEVGRINDRITEFLNYSRPPKLRPEPVNLEELARDAMRIFEVQTNETGVDAR